MSDGLLFDDDEELSDAPLMWGLVVLEPFANSADLNTWEEQCRRSEYVPIMFISVDEETGREVFENSAQFHTAMGLGPNDPMPSIEEADRWGR